MTAIREELRRVVSSLQRTESSRRRRVAAAARNSEDRIAQHREQDDIMIPSPSDTRRSLRERPWRSTVDTHLRSRP